MNLSEMTFGVELEITIPAGALQIGAYHVGTEIQGFPAGWKAMNDGSIRPTIAGHVGCEIVSPVLRGAAGLLQVAEVVRKLNAMGGRVNASCGFHVHVGFPTRCLPKLGHLVYLVANLEGGLFAMTGTKNRERNQFCGSIKRAYHRTLNYEACGREGTVGAALQHYTDAATQQVVRPTASGRYHTLNLDNLLRGTKPTVEFRVFQGTLNLHKIVAFVRVCLGIVQKASVTRGRRATWDAAPGDVPTTGVEQIQRLFYRLGWTRGATNEVYGLLEADGIGGLDDSKAIIKRMAEKYDQSA